MTDSNDRQDCREIRVMLRDLEHLVEGQKWNLDAAAIAAWRERPWAGADVVICTSAEQDSSDGDTFVVTPFAGELSWLFDYLKEVCGDLLNYMNKHAFYGRLAHAANQYSASREPRLANPKDLCFAVLRETARMLDEVAEGGFRDPDTVLVRGVEVHLHADAIRNGTGFATYRYQFDAPVELKGVPFELRGKSYRIGGLFHRTNLDGLVTCVAFYSEETAS